MVDGPVAKLNRAYEHLAELDGLIRAFASENYRVDANPDFWETGVSNGQIIIYAEATNEPPTEVWGPIVGDTVHGLRSALDQLAWTLSVDFDSVGPPPDPLPPGNRWRRISFPIRLTEPDWDAAASNALWAIDPNLLPLLKQKQPFGTGAGAPVKEPLAMLDELWSIDKHRHLHLVNATAELHEVPTVNPLPSSSYELPPLGTFEVVSRQPPGKLDGRTEVGRVRYVPAPGGILGMTIPQIHMDPRLLIHVAFEAGAPAYGMDVLQLLNDLAVAVESVLKACPTP